MASWRVAKSLLTLRDQVNAQWPHRDKSSDGTIGDTAHQQEHSEHNPDANGVVRAEDISNDPKNGPSSEALAQVIVKSRDPRVLYVISNRKISNSTIQNWAWRPYNGSNPHDHHCHISVVPDPHLYDDTRPWDLSGMTDSHPAAPPVAPAVQAPPASVSRPAWWDDVLAAASASKAIHHAWAGRGQAPAGYIKGMALAMGYLHQGLIAVHDASLLMATPNTGNDSTDALSWYGAAFGALGMRNTDNGPDTLRHLITLMVGLGMRESSGKFCEGRDTSADNVQSDTAEAGMFQMSWDIRGGSKLIADLFEHYSAAGDDPEGLGPIFHEGVSCSAINLANFGSGDGKEFQRMCKASPMFSVAVCGVGMRTIRRHWGPINRHEAEISPDVDALFVQVQAIVDSHETAGA